MHIDIAGHHLEITDSIRQIVHQKLEKITTHYPQISSFNVILTVERNDQIAEVTTQFMGATIAVEAKDHDLYTAIGDMAKKLDAKLAHKKGAMTSNRHKKPDIGDPLEATS